AAAVRTTVEATCRAAIEVELKREPAERRPSALCGDRADTEGIRISHRNGDGAARSVVTGSVRRDYTQVVLAIRQGPGGPRRVVGSRSRGSDRRPATAAMGCVLELRSCD